MSFKLMSAVIPVSSNTINQPEDSKKLLSQLLECVQQCQKRYGGKTELATEFDSCVAGLCLTIEAVFLHGLRNKPLESQPSSTFKQVSDIVANSLNLGGDNPSFWPFLKKHLTKHEQERYLVLKHIWTDTGRGKAWIRSALNERSLERYFHTVLSIRDILYTYYEDWALLRDEEKNSMLPNMAAGLCSILFAISIDKPEHNSGTSAQKLEKLKSRPEPIIEAPIAEPRKEPRKKRKVAKQLISFEDDDSILSSSVPSSSSSIASESNSNCEFLSTKSNLSRVDSKLEGKMDDVLEVTDTSSVTSDTIPDNTRYSKHDIRRDHAVPNDLARKDPVSHGLNKEHGGKDHERKDHEKKDYERKDHERKDHERKDHENKKERMTRKLSIETSGSRDKFATVIEGTLTPVQSNIGELTPISVEKSRESPNSSDDALEIPTDISAVMTALEMKNIEEVNRLKEKIGVLNKENDSLKEQLKKYIGAVQMLKRDDASLQKALEGLQIEEQPNYKNEAKLYETKLVQVAEMHAELMDFNVILQQSLHKKDALLERLKGELEELRGPMSTDELSEDSQSSVNVWIPSAFLTGTGSDAHHVYQIFLRAGNDEWNIYRRYAQFYALHTDLKKLDPAISTFDFPPKKSLGKKDSALVEDRRKRLQKYLRRVILHWPELSQCNSRYLLEQHLGFFKDSTEIDLKSKKRTIFSSNRRNNGTTNQSNHYTGL